MHKYSLPTFTLGLGEDLVKYTTKTESKAENNNNDSAVPLVRYSGLFLKGTREELKQTDQRKRKLMTMHKALHPRYDVDRLWLSRKEKEKGLSSIQESVDSSIWRLEDYIQKCWGRLIAVNRNNTVSTNNNRTNITGKQKNGKKNNCMDISSDKQEKSHTRKFGQSWLEFSVLLFRSVPWVRLNSQVCPTIMEK